MVIFFPITFPAYRGITLYSLVQTFSGFVPKWVRKTRMAQMVSKSLVNHLGLTLTKEDLQKVVDLMEPYGQISNGIEFLNPPLDVRNQFTLLLLSSVNFYGYLPDKKISLQ